MNQQTEKSGDLTKTVRITTRAMYLNEQSNPAARRYVFSYTITIENLGSESVQLMTRHWLITDADGRLQEVHGDGVIGEQPVIKPGAAHTYTSGAILETPVGTMEGRYGMVSAKGTGFDAPIPVFRLAVPGVLN